MLSFVTGFGLASTIWFIRWQARETDLQVAARVLSDIGTTLAFTQVVSEEYLSNLETSKQLIQSVELGTLNQSIKK